MAIYISIKVKDKIYPECINPKCSDEEKNKLNKEEAAKILRMALDPDKYEEPSSPDDCSKHKCVVLTNELVTAKDEILLKIGESSSINAWISSEF